MSSEHMEIDFVAQKFQILMIEDSEINVRIMLEILRRAGYKVDFALNGQAGLESVSICKPDLILLDVVMPKMDGFQVCKLLKSNPETADIPIIFMTAEKDTNSIVQGFELGAVDYIKKPVRAQETLARIKTHLTIKELQTGLGEEIVKREALISDLTAFTHMVAHDLKNPVSNILGFSEILIADRDKLDEEMLLETLDYIKQSGNKVYQIIDSLLLLANVRLKEVVYEPVDIHLLILEAKARFKYQLDVKNVRFSYPESWPRVVGYSLWIEEVLANLISNAIKYGGTPPEICLGFELLEGDLVKIKVKDNGEGLNDKQQAELFKPFVKLHHSREGHGLGLSIVKKIIEKMGGTVGASSKIGEGSTFYFTLPMEKTPTPIFDSLQPLR